MAIFSLDQFLTSIPKLLPYVPVTLLLTIASLFFGSMIGLVLAYMKLSKNKIISGIAYFYSALIRGTPFLVLLFVVYYGLPLFFQAVFHQDINGWEKMIFMLITMSFFGGSRLSDVFRTAYEAVDKSQMEAALSVGLSGFKALTRIIIPQAFFIALPNMGNTFLGLMLETSLGYTIGLFDLMGKAKQLNTLSYGVYRMEIYLAVALIYWAISIVFDKGMGRLEKNLGKNYRSMVQVKEKAG